jgi:hypothetical protein
MSIAKQNLITVLSSQLDSTILDRLIDEYLDIKQQFFLKKYRPSELNTGRFCECVLRLLQDIDTKGSYIPFGTSLGNSNTIINKLEQSRNLPESLRVFILKLVRVALDIRNRRDIAHVGGGEINPNYSDALLLVNIADWILIEIVRHYYKCPMEEAQKIVDSIIEVRVPVITEVNGFLRVQNTNLKARDASLVILYYKRPNKVGAPDLCKWVGYGNSSRFKNDILSKLHDEALIHYDKVSGNSELIEKGVRYVEKYIPFDFFV